MHINRWKEREEFWGAPCYREESEVIIDMPEDMESILDQLEDYDVIDSIAIDRNGNASVMVSLIDTNSGDNFDIEIYSDQYIDLEGIYNNWQVWLDDHQDSDAMPTRKQIMIWGGIL